MDDLIEFMLFLCGELKEEMQFDYYIHKSVMSDMTYDEFKSNIKTKEDARKMTKEDVKNVVNNAIEFLPEILMGGEF